MRVIKAKRVNIEAVFKILILVGFSWFFFLTIRTGKVNQFVHPRIVPYMKFAVAAMLMIALLIVRDIFKPRRIMAFSIPTADMTSESMSYSGTKPKVQTIESTNNASTSEAGAYSSGSSQSNGIPVQGDGESLNNSLKLHGDTIVIDDNFVMWIQEISDYPSKYIGKKVTVTGFVYRDKNFKHGEFVAARLMMVCCAADLSPAGLLAHYDKTPELKQDGWFKFTGKIENGEFKGQQMPVINITKAEKVQKPKEEYVYPY
jgi:putative membrane protein